MERQASWDTAKKMPKNAVMLTCPKSGWQALMVLDASDLYWRCFLAQVSPGDFAGSVAAEGMRREPLAFFIGQFKVS